ncbi:Uncharacterised protein [Mycobacteroides abscessus]|nr:Uncharacterised protein [Mycobacteroides abscessus]
MHDGGHLPRRVVEGEHRQVGRCGRFERQLRCDTKVSAAYPAYRPEQVGLGVRGYHPDLAVGGYHPGRDQLVTGKAKPAGENPHPATQGQSGDTDGRAGTAGQHAARPRNTRIDIDKPGSRSDHRPRSGNRHRRHAREIDHQPIVRNAVRGVAVPTTTRRYRKTGARCELHTPCHILIGRAEGHRTGMIHIEERIEGPAGLVHGGVTTHHQGSG